MTRASLDTPEDHSSLLREAQKRIRAIHYQVFRAVNKEPVGLCRDIEADVERGDR